MLEATFRAGLRRSLIDRAEGVMKFCDCLHCLLRQFHFFGEIRNLCLYFRYLRNVAVYRGDHRLKNFRRLGHVSQCNVFKRLLNVPGAIGRGVDGRCTRNSASEPLAELMPEFAVCLVLPIA